MKILIQWDENDFERLTGSKPENDDMERTNCSEAGTKSHECCGICIHNLPVFKCAICFVKSHENTFKRMADYIFQDLEARLNESDNQSHI